MEFNKTQTVNFTSKLSDFEVMDTEFTKCKCYALASGDNANGSDITMQAIDKAIQRGEFYNKPIVAHLYRDENDGSWRVGGHDSKWVISNTSMEVINECIPFGTIPESSNVRKEEVLEPDGTTVNTYVVMDVILWTGRFNIMDAAYSDDVYFNQSCEISINDYHYKDNDILAIDDFTFSALCLLNKSSDFSKNVRPCFPSCRVEKIKSFSLDEDKFKQNFELMLDKLKQYESATAVHDKETNNKPNKEEKKFMDLEKLNAFLSAFTFKDNCDNDVAKYALLGDATETSFTVIDREDNFKVYTVEFALDDEQNIVADWDAKVEKKFAIVSADEESAIDLNTVIGEYAQSRADMITESLTVSFNEKIDEMAKEYENLSKELETSNKKLADFEAEKAEADRLAHKAEVDAVVAEFAKKIGRSPKFLVYKAKLNADEVTVEKVTQDLTLMAGQEMLGGKSASYSYQPTETKVANKENNEVQNRYGNLLSKYMK